ncbi:MAG TPA: DUF6167 family protein [Nocardioidaceae bacterium]|jgi:hypothetical protein|nr:DUF6167 family protein [Nocardioidaceae bacterium]
MSRVVWFAAGAGAGVYAMVKARRTAEAFTPDGLRDRAAGLSLGLDLFKEEVASEMAARENDLRERLGLRLDDSTGTPAIESGAPLQLTRKGND